MEKKAIVCSFHRGEERVVFRVFPGVESVSQRGGVRRGRDNWVGSRGERRRVWTDKVWRDCHERLQEVRDDAGEIDSESELVRANVRQRLPRGVLF